MALTQKDIDRVLGKRQTLQRVNKSNKQTITNTPRDIISGTWADILKPIVSNPVGEFLGGADLQRALDSASYGVPLTTSKNIQTTSFRPEYLAAGLAITPVGKAKKATKAVKMSAEEAIAKGYWHPVGNDKKLKIPISEMTSVVKPIENISTPKIITPEDLFGGAGIVTKGDRSGVGVLEEINGIKLNKPVKLEGGFRFMDVNDPYNEIWASGKGVVTQLANKGSDIASSGRDAYLISTTAGHGATDFNAMMTDALFEQMQSSKISKKSRKEFDEIMRERRPDWLGIDNPNVLEQLNKNGALRHTFHDVVELEKFQKSGFPDIASTRKAITDPNLLDTPNAYSGYRVGKLNPDKLIIDNPAMQHTTYPVHMGGNLVGTTQVQLPVQNWFPDFFAQRRELNKPISGDAYALERAKPVQEFNQKWLDQIMPVYENALKGLL